jgi:hypothetical protein
MRCEIPGTSEKRCKCASSGEAGYRERGGESQDTQRTSPQMQSCQRHKNHPAPTPATMIIANHATKSQSAQECPAEAIQFVVIQLVTVGTATNAATTAAAKARPACVGERTCQFYAGPAGWLVQNGMSKKQWAGAHLDFCRASGESSSCLTPLNATARLLPLLVLRRRSHPPGRAN